MPPTGMPKTGDFGMVPFRRKQYRAPSYSIRQVRAMPAVYKQSDKIVNIKS
jgi:hypothetical protein